MTAQFDHKARTSRRNVLAFLGLAGASAPALQTEAMAFSQAGASARYDKDHAGSFPQLASAISCRACAHALRQLADGLESGRVIPEGLDVKSSLGNAPSGIQADWLNQELRFAFYLVPEGTEKPFNQGDGFEWLDDRDARLALEDALRPTVRTMHDRVKSDPASAWTTSISLDKTIKDILRELEKRKLALVKLV